MKDDLATYLASIDSRLLVYLDAQRDLSTETIAHLYRYAVALMQGLIAPDAVLEDWEDFFDLADAFVFAYGSERLELLNRRAALLDMDGDRTGVPLTADDRLFLVNLVQELGALLTEREANRR
jgi:hypothetical protein